MRKKLLWVGDGPDVPSGFGRATREILNVVQHAFDVTVLGINANGDDATVPYKVYTCYPGGDLFGVGRLIWMCDLVQPDVIVIQQDGWNFPNYIKQLSYFPQYAKVPVIAIVAVDGQNFQGEWLAGVAHAVFWTEWALNEARQGGYTGPASIIPLGVDVEVYRPQDRAQARLRLLPSQVADAFIVGNVNRNQPRKRLDLTIRYFSEWVIDRGIEDAYLFLHVAPTGDTGINVKQLASHYGIIHRLILMEPPTWYGVSEQTLVDTYNCFDLLVSTTQGEGMGLPALEAMACGVPCLLPDWAAYSDWAKDAAVLIPCTSTAIGPPYVNVIGGIPDGQEFIKALDDHYIDVGGRTHTALKGWAHVQKSRFRWTTIGQSFIQVATNVMATPVGLKSVLKESVV